MQPYINLSNSPLPLSHTLSPRPNTPKTIITKTKKQCPPWTDISQNSSISSAMNNFSFLIDRRGKKRAKVSLRITWYATRCCKYQRNSTNGWKRPTAEYTQLSKNTTYATWDNIRKPWLYNNKTIDCGNRWDTIAWNDQEKSN